MSEKKMSNVETLRELTADELDIIAGGISGNAASTGNFVSNNGEANIFGKVNPPGNHKTEVFGAG